GFVVGGGAGDPEHIACRRLVGAADEQLADNAELDPRRRDIEEALEFVVLDAAEFEAYFADDGDALDEVLAFVALGEGVFQRPGAGFVVRRIPKIFIQPEDTGEDDDGEAGGETDHHSAPPSFSGCVDDGADGATLRRLAKGR